MKKISVVIPVYNMEKYIEKCLNSIYNQQMKDIEIIIVNDGSVDNSEAIIKQWIENHGKINVKYLKKENGGLSDARNFAIHYVTGKYISFIDADDYIDKNLYSNLEKYIDEDIDLIKFKMKIVDENGDILEKVDGPIFDRCTGEEGFEKLCTTDKFLDPACIYLYKTSFYKENGFKYKKGAYHEDFGLTSLIMLKAKTFVSTKECGYNYLQTTNSITRNKDYEKEIKKSQDLLSHYDDMIEKIDDYEISNKSKELVKRYYTNTLILKTEDLKNEDKKHYINEIKKRKIYKNIKPYDIKQLIKRVILKFNVNLYLKLR